MIILHFQLGSCDIEQKSLSPVTIYFKFYLIFILSLYWRVQQETKRVDLNVVCYKEFLSLNGIDIVLDLDLHGL